jgi:hypothetical protein
VIYSDDLDSLGLSMQDPTTIQANEKELFKIVRKLNKNKISIKQIRYGSTNLEKHFLDLTEEQDA